MAAPPRPSAPSALTHIRSVKYFRALFRRAGLRVVAQRKHLGFPGDMLPVYLYALVPDSRPDSKRITRSS